MLNLLFVVGTQSKAETGIERHIIEADMERSVKKQPKRKKRYYEPKDSYMAVVPKKICFETLLKENQLRVARAFKHEYQLIDKIAGILDIILRRYQDSYKMKDYCEEVYISATKTFKPYYDEYGSIIDFLLKSKVIEIVTKEVKGQNARSYRLTEQFRNDGTRYYFIKDKTVIEKLRELGSDNDAIERYPELYHSVLDVKIDKAQALKMADILLKDDEKKISKRNQYEISFDNIHSLTPLFKKDKSSGRLHTSITNLKKEFRQFLSINGKELVEIDIKSSQPFFLASLLNEEAWSNFDIESIIKKNSQYLSDDEIVESRRVLRENSQFPAGNRYYIDDGVAVIPLPGYPIEYMRCGSYRTGDMAIDIQMNRDFFTFNGTYSDMVLSGMLYEFISWNLDFKTRKEGKDEMWKILYNPPRFKCKGREVFEAYFPEILDFADTINKGYVKTKKLGRKPHEQSSTLALLLQTLEADFMLDSLVPFIHDNFPELPLLTIHDSVLVPKGFEDEVKACMEEIAVTKLGLLPMLSIG